MVVKKPVIVCGSCVVDLPCLTVSLETPVGPNEIHAIEPIVPQGGGITCNTGIALQRLGVPTAILTYVGDDTWGAWLRDLLIREGLNTDLLHTHASDPTTSVVVLVDSDGQRSFLVPGVKTATKSIDAQFIRRHLGTIAQASHFIFGYYGRMPRLEPELLPLLRDIRDTGCRTVMDTAGKGGDPRLLFEILPHLDIYIPSEEEAREQTGLTNPKEMLASYRRANAHGILGVKLGERGALLSHPDEGLIPVAPTDPGCPVIDTTGAGDCFLAGLIAGLENGLNLQRASQWASAAGACAVTERGGYAGIRKPTITGRSS